VNSTTDATALVPNIALSDADVFPTDHVLAWSHTNQTAHVTQ